MWSRFFVTACKATNLWTAWHWTSGLQDCNIINSHCLSHTICGTPLRQPQETKAPSKMLALLQGWVFWNPYKKLYKNKCLFCDMSVLASVWPLWGALTLVGQLQSSEFLVWVMAPLIGYQKEGLSPKTFLSQCSSFGKTLPLENPYHMRYRECSFSTDKHLSKEGIKCWSFILEAIPDLWKWLFWTTLPLKGSVAPSSSSEECEDGLSRSTAFPKRCQPPSLLSPSIVLTWGWEMEVSGRATFALEWVIESSVKCLTPASGSFWT